MSAESKASSSAGGSGGSTSATAPPAAVPASAVLSLDADEHPGSALDTSTPQLITLISKEGRRLQVSRQALMASELCKTTLEGDREANEIPLYHIEGAIVQKVIDYLTYHLKIPARKIEKPLVSNQMKDLVDKWDVNFIENGAASPPPGPLASPASTPTAQQLAQLHESQSTLFKLLLAANYLNIKSLLQLTCAKVASLMKGKTPDQIRDTFAIRKDYTQAEEEEVRKEYKDLIG